MCTNVIWRSICQKLELSGPASFLPSLPSCLSLASPPNPQDPHSLGTPEAVPPMVIFLPAVSRVLHSFVLFLIAFFPLAFPFCYHGMYNWKTLLDAFFSLFLSLCVAVSCMTPRKEIKSLLSVTLNDCIGLQDIHFIYHSRFR